MASIPDFVVEYFLLGRTRRDALNRYTQDGGIVSDVWLAFAKDLQASRRVLVAPSKGTNAADLAYALHKTITAYRASGPPARGKPGVSPLENFVAVTTLYLDELLGIVLPMSAWWHDKNLSALHRTAMRSGPKLEEKLEQAIRIKLGREEDELMLRQGMVESIDVYPDRRVIQAASLAALIGVFRAAEKNSAFFDDLQGIDPRTPEGEEAFVGWINRQAEVIAQAAREELARPFLPALLNLPADMPGSKPPSRTERDDPPVLVQRVFLDREASLADTAAIGTIKADAAYRVFDMSCRDVTWAIIDSGIATTHPAFEDHDAKDSRGNPILPLPTRVRATYDFTSIERIRNFDLISDEDGSPGRSATIRAVVDELEKLPGRTVP